MAILMEVVLAQLVLGVPTINRWNYIGNGTPAAVSMSFALSSAFGAFPLGGSPSLFPPDTVLARLQALQSTGVTFTALAVKNVYSTTDFYETPFNSGVAGSVGTGELEAPEITYPFKTNIVRTDIGRGRKSFTGVAESVVGTGGVFNSAAGSLPFLLAEAMSEVLEYDDEGNTLTFSPAIVHREKYQTEPPAMGVAAKYAYRYYEDEAEQLTWVASGVTWFAAPKTGTQNSRKD